jgi:hypothetical protein
MVSRYPDWSNADTGFSGWTGRPGRADGDSSGLCWISGMRTTALAWYCARTKVRHEHIAAAICEPAAWRGGVSATAMGRACHTARRRACCGAAFSRLHFRPLHLERMIKRGQIRSRHQQPRAVWKTDFADAGRGNRGAAGMLHGGRSDDNRRLPFAWRESSGCGRRSCQNGCPSVTDAAGKTPCPIEVAADSRTCNTNGRMMANELARNSERVSERGVVAADAE